MIEHGINKTSIIAALSKSTHGKLEEYLPLKQAVEQEPEFMAHLVAWNFLNGQVRDSQTALPVITLSAPSFPGEYVENSLAHLAVLTPRDLEKAYRFAKQIKVPGRMKSVQRTVTQYLRQREAKFNRWQQTAVRHRAAMRSLYALVHVKPAPFANEALFGERYQRGTMLEAVQQLRHMSVAEQASVVLGKKLPFTVAVTSTGRKLNDPDFVLALIQRMTPTELVTNQKMLIKAGVRTIPALRAAYEEALARAADSKKSKNVLKTTRAAEMVEDEVIREKLKGLQEKQLNKMSGVEGNWLVLVDKSGSMKNAIEAGRQVAGILAKMVKGRVWMVFFDIMPRGTEVTGMTYEQIKEKTRGVTANGGTSIGCGLLGMMEANVEVDGIAIVSDGGENHNPYFYDVYARYSQKIGKEVPVYFYRIAGGEGDSFSRLMANAHFDVQIFDVGTDVDYYSLPNLVATMNTNRYSLVQQILDTPLRTVADVLGIEVEDPITVAV